MSSLTRRALAVELARLRIGPVDLVFFLVRDFLGERREGDISGTLPVSSSTGLAGDSFTACVMANENNPDGVAGVVEPESEATVPLVSVR